MHLLRISVIGFLLLLIQLPLKAQSEQAVVDMMNKAGYENIRIHSVGQTLYVAFEDRTDKQPWDGLISLVRLWRQADFQQTLVANLETGGVARITMKYEPSGALDVSGATAECGRMLDDKRAQNKSYGKLLITALPSITLRNARTDVLFTTTIGIAPTLQMELWKGAQLDAQVILPIYNTMEEQFDHVRPGIIALTQRVKIANNWQVIGSVGNFTNQRAGANLQMRYDLPNGWWGVSTSGGVTVSSTTWEGKWLFSKQKRVNFQLSSYLYLPIWNTKLEACGGRFVRGDYGVRANLSRRFHNVTVSLYGMVTDGEINGGFNFILPLTATRIKKIRPVSFVWPNWFDWEYSAQSGPDYVSRGLGQTYLSRLYQRADESYWNPIYIKSEIINYLLNTQEE